jgi:hypothetical protein
VAANGNVSPTPSLFNWVDMIIDSVVMKKNSAGYRYHEFTIKNTWDKKYQTTNYDSMNCSYYWTNCRWSCTKWLLTNIPIPIQEIDSLGTAKIVLSVEQSSSIITQWFATWSCYLYTEDANKFNNNFYFKGSQIYSFLPSLTFDTSNSDLTIERVEIGAWGESKITIKNIWLGPAVINQAISLKNTCACSSCWERDSFVASKTIYENKTINAGETFDMFMSMNWAVDNCYLYYEWKEINTVNNYYTIPK